MDVPDYVDIIVFILYIITIINYNNNSIILFLLTAISTFPGPQGQHFDLQIILYCVIDRIVFLYNNRI